MDDRSPLHERSPATSTKSRHNLKKIGKGRSGVGWGGERGLGVRVVHTSDRLQNWPGRRMISEQGLVPKAMPSVARPRFARHCAAAAARLNSPRSPLPLATSASHSASNSARGGRESYTAEMLAMYRHGARSHHAPVFASRMSGSDRSLREMSADLQAHEHTAGMHARNACAESSPQGRGSSTGSDVQMGMYRDS